MLKALLWKEWRETRLFFSLMILTILSSSLLLNILEQDKSLKVYAFTIVYSIVFIFFTVLLAASQFSGDEESGTSDYLMSHPVKWFSIWLIKNIYGIISIILFGLYILLMTKVYILPLLESDTLIHTLFLNFPQFILCIFFKALLLLIPILNLYFIGCAVSINLKSTFKAALVTFLVSGFFFLLLLYSFSDLYFRNTYYLFWVIFPILLFIVFIKYRSENRLSKIFYLVSPFVGIIFLIVTALRGISLLGLINDILINGLPNVNPLYFFYKPAILIILPSAIITSLFAFGIYRRKYPLWWRTLNCWNFMSVFAFCLGAFIITVLPSYKSIEPAGLTRYYSFYESNTNFPVVITESYFPRHNPSFTALYYMYQVGVSEKYFALDRNTGEMHFFGREKFMLRDSVTVSEDNRWVMYVCPTLNWGVYYTYGLWVENLETGRQYFLTKMDIKIKGYVTTEWFDEGNRLLIIKDRIGKRHKDDGILLFSFSNEKPQKLVERQDPDILRMQLIAKSDKLYFYDWGKNLVACYNRDLSKKRDITVMQDELIFVPTGADKTKRWNRIQNTDLFISPGGKYMIFAVRGFPEEIGINNGKYGHTENKKQVWSVSLHTGERKILYEGKLHYHYYGSRSNFLMWNPVADNLWFDTRLSESGNNELHLVDLNNGVHKILISEPGVNNGKWSGHFAFQWSGNGKYLITLNGTEKTKQLTVRLYAFDLQTLSCRLISSKPNLKGDSWQHVDLWSPDRSQTVFRSEDDKKIWRLDLNNGTWAKILYPSDDYYTLLGVSNRGEVFVAPSGEAQIYRLTENQSEIIFQGK